MPHNKKPKEQKNEEQPKKDDYIHQHTQKRVGREGHNRAEGRHIAQHQNAHDDAQ